MSDRQNDGRSDDTGTSNAHIYELMTAARDAMAEALKLAEELSDQLSVELLLSSLQLDIAAEQEAVDAGGTDPERANRRPASGPDNSEDYESDCT